MTSFYYFWVPESREAMKFIVNYSIK